MDSRHIVRSFSQDLQRLSSLIIRMGGMAEAQIDLAIQAVVQRNADLAAQVRTSDESLDGYERELNSEAVRLLALRQPMARDLREIVSALKISSDLERIGDYAANIAKRSVVLARLPAVRPAAVIPRMGKLAKVAVAGALDAYAGREIANAAAALERDETQGNLYDGLFQEAVACMIEDPRTITSCTHLLFMASNLERIGDHAANIAQAVHVLVAGSPPDDRRPPRDSLV